MRKYKLSKKSRRFTQKRKKKRLSSTALWAIGIISIMAFSIIGFLWSGPEGGTKYNEIDFVPQGNPQTGQIDYWVANLEGRDVNFYNHPSDVLFINLSQPIKQLLQSSNVFILTSDPEDENKETIGLIDFEFQEVLGPSGKAAITTFTANNSFDRPVYTCENATQFEPVIYWKTGKSISITLENNCIIAESPSSFGLIRIRDRLLYAYFNVIE